MINTTTIDLAWLSYHIYYRHDLGLLLLNIIDPVLHQWYEQGLITNHFFIRYWEDGPHIRLRLKSTIDSTEILAEDLTRAHKNIFDSTVNYDPEFRIVRSLYVQEAERFGGLSSMPMAEGLFESSSTQVMQVLKSHNGSWTYSLGISHALQMHLLFLKAVGISPEVAVQLLDFMFELYIKFALKRPFKNGVRSEISKVNDFFEASYLRQAEEINFLCAAIWKQNVWEGTNWRAQWCSSIHKIVHKYNFLLIEGSDDGIGFDDRAGRHRFPKNLLYQWFQLSSYFHLTNNRIGIHLRDEAFIYYCLKKGLSAISIQNYDKLESHAICE